jgi:hypothetical protein
MICVDNSEWMRNGDYPPSRFAAQAHAFAVLSGAKTEVWLLSIAHACVAASARGCYLVATWGFECLRAALRVPFGRPVNLDYAGEPGEHGGAGGHGGQGRQRARPANQRLRQGPVRHERYAKPPLTS